jgi:hypothetical protein
MFVAPAGGRNRSWVTGSGVRGHPTEDITGRGVFAAMAAFGLDPSGWLESGPATDRQDGASAFGTRTLR